MKKILGSFILVLFLFTGCTITQTYHFNDDFSGSAITTVNLKSKNFFFISNPADSSSLPKSTYDSIESVLLRKKLLYQEIGATNVKYNILDENNELTISYSYDFNNLEILNEALSNEKSIFDIIEGNEKESEFDIKKGTQKFCKKGKNKLTFYLPKLKNDSILSIKQSELEILKNYKGYTGIDNKYELTMTFDRTIKSADNEKLNISPDKKALKLSVSLFDIISKDFMTDFSLKLNKK